MPERETAPQLSVDPELTTLIEGIYGKAKAIFKDEVAMEGIKEVAEYSTEQKVTLAALHAVESALQAHEAALQLSQQDPHRTIFVNLAKSRVSELLSNLATHANIPSW